MVRGIRTDLNGRAHYFYHGVLTQHTPSEMYFLDNFLRIHKPKNVIELGTKRGGVTILFGFHAALHNGQVLTIDINDEAIQIPDFIPNIWFYHGDSFSEEAKELTRKFNTRERTLIYCDGQPKAQGFIEYARFLKPNDFIMVHDKGTEVKYPDIEETVEEYNLLPMYEKEISKLKCRIFAFRRMNP